MLKKMGFFIFLTIGSAWAASSEYEGVVPYKSDRVHVTVDNMGDFVGLPSELEEPVASWREEKHGNTSRDEMLRSVVPFSYCKPTEERFYDRKDMERKKAVVQEWGHEVASGSSLVFGGVYFDGKEFWIRIAGDVLRWGNRREYLRRFCVGAADRDPEIDFGSAYTEERTHQTLSVAVNTYFVRKIADDLGAKCLVAPDCYAVQIERGIGWHDNNVFVLQKHLQQFEKLDPKNNPKHRAMLDDRPLEDVRNMYVIARDSGAFWDEGKMGWTGDVERYQGFFAQVDLEQQMKTPSNEFFRRQDRTYVDGTPYNDDYIRLNRRFSIKNLCNLFSRKSQPYQQLMALIAQESDDVLNDAEKEWIRRSGSDYTE